MTDAPANPAPTWSWPAFASTYPDVARDIDRAFLATEQARRVVGEMEAHRKDDWSFTFYAKALMTYMDSYREAEAVRRLKRKD